MTGPAAHAADEFPRLDGYSLLERLAEGKSSRVFRAKRLRDGLPLILKIARDQQPRTAARFEHEYAVLRRFRSAGIVSARGLEHDQGRLILVLEDFGATSLDRVCESGPLPLELALDAAAQVAEALSTVHEAGLLHGRVCPANIVRNPQSGTAKLIDFADTCAPGQLAAVPETAQAQVLPYLAPERTGRLNRSVDHRADLYSLGATLYELLTARPLFAVSEPQEWFHCHIAREPAPLGTIDAGIPPVVADIVLRLLAKSADERYQSAQGVAADLRRCLELLRTEGRIETFPLGRRDLAEQFRIPQRLYGREQELERLHNAYQRCAEGAAELVLLGGPPGIGKSRLVQELRKTVTAQDGYVITGKCDQLQLDTPYQPVASALRELLRQLLSESDAQLQHWRQQFSSALGNQAQLMIELVPELERIIGPQAPAPQLPALEAERRFTRLFQQFTRVFCRPTRPLVIFIDDLQWIDAGSLKLLELLFDDRQAQHLLVIGSYRSDIERPQLLAQSLSHLRTRGTRIEHIELAPLDAAALKTLVAETLPGKIAERDSLAGLVRDKTGGNPFFAERFLEHLHQQQLIVYDIDHGIWRWDEEKIRRQRITDNVADLMSANLARLSPASRELLQIAASLGSRFRLQLLAIATGRDRAEILRGLREAQTAGFIVTVEDTQGDPDEFEFTHDRVQQAAYELIPASQRDARHLGIGRALQRGLSPSEQERALFEIVGHLNRGRALLSEEAARLELAQLNLLAARRSGTAYETALHYLRMGLELLGDGGWELDYPLCLQLHLEAASAALRCSAYDCMDALLDAALPRARDLLDRASLQEIRISSLIARSRMEEAISTALPILRALGHNYPDEPRDRHIVAALIKLRWILHGKSMDDLRGLPEMTDPRQRMAMRIGSSIGTAAMIAKPKLMPLMILRGMETVATYGYCEQGPPLIAAYGLILCGALGQVQRGERFGRLALELTERFKASRVEGRVLHVYAAFIQHWSTALQDTLPQLRQAFSTALDNGDFEYAANAASIHAMHAFMAGMNLDRLNELLDTHYEALANVRQGDSAYYLHVIHKAVAELRGGRHDSELALLAETYQARLELDRAIQVVANLAAIELNIYFGRVDDALSIADTFNTDASGLVSSTPGAYMKVHFHWLNALAHLLRCHTARGAERRRLLRAARSSQRRVARWARGNPANTLHRQHILNGERLWLAGREWEAHAAYDQAAALAAEQGFQQEHALALERAASMHLAAGRTLIGEAYLRRARDAYRHWGAHAKAAALEQTHDWLTDTAISEADAPRTRSIDVTALMKALKAIAGERVHGRMVEAIMATAIEFAGAQRGKLILRNHKAGLCVEAESSVDQERMRILQSIPLGECSDLAQTVTNYVIHTGESVVVDDAQRGSDILPGLERDPHVAAAGVRAILCLPIATGDDDKRDLIGLLYLENNRAGGSFTAEQLDVLELVAMSAAGRLELSRRAAVDGLTQLYNHEYFQNMLQREFAQARRHNRPLSLILVDIDHFKRFNDTWGHPVGDRVLKEVANSLKESCRESDTVARYGGEELAVILPEANLATAAEVAERVRLAIEQTSVEHEGVQLHVTVSAGVATLSESVAEHGQLIKLADEALYRAKAEGRNRVALASEAI